MRLVRALRRCLLGDVGSASGAPVEVFVSFDPSVDAAVAARFVTATHFAEWPVAVTGWSGESAGPRRREEVDRLLRSASLMVVVCGPETATSAAVASDVAVAHDRDVPHLLVQGYRRRRSTRPASVADDEPVFVLTPRNMALVLQGWGEKLARAPW